MATEGDWISRYKFCQPLGQGGMGTVYLAEDRWNDNATRVIKQLIKRPASEEENDESIRLFRREAQILKNLDHHGIVKLYDFHVEDQRYFLVMDYVPGRNLEMIINTNGPFSSEKVVCIAIHCCDVLDHLHNLQPEPIIYRDLKPSNLMLTPDGRIIFIDFGIARQFVPKEIATRVVTAGYSPPEQYFGKPETRSDIYSLGATMSHLLTGVRPKPLTGCNPAAINNEIMPSLNNLIRKMTAHEVDDRPPSANAVRYGLYKIYKELHPEFEIPEDTDSQIYEDRARAQEAIRLKYGSKNFPNRVFSSNSVKKLQEGPDGTGYSDDESTDVLTMFVERVKRLLWNRREP